MDGEPEVDPEPLNEKHEQDEGLGLSEAKLERDTEGVDVKQAAEVMEKGGDILVDWEALEVTLCDPLALGLKVEGRDNEGDSVGVRLPD